MRYRESGVFCHPSHSCEPDISRRLDGISSNLAQTSTLVETPLRTLFNDSYDTVTTINTILSPMSHVIPMFICIVCL